MGDPWYKVEEGKHKAYSSIVSGKTKFLLQINGHHSKNIDSKCSMYVPFKSEAQINEKSIEDCVEEFKSGENELERLKLFQLSVRETPKKVAGNYLRDILEKDYREKKI